MFPFDVILRAVPGAPIDAAAAPARAAVVLLAAEADRPVLLATTADARAFLRRRLDQPVSPDDADNPPPARHAPPRADLSSIVASASLTLVGSGLEADLAFLAIARRTLPQSWEALTERWRAWFIHLDPDAPVPAWRKTNLADHPRSAPDPATLIGPILNKDTAGRVAEAIDDLFDLCRFPGELALAPRGTPCAYKEMGKCPAPCDGSEPIDHYRDRVRHALATLRANPAERAAPIEAAMRAAAANHDFEAAARHKARLDALALLDKPATRQARPLDTLSHLAILGSGRPGWARVWRISPHACAPIADVDGTRPALGLDALHGALRDPTPAAVIPGPGTLDPALLGVIARHMLAPPARRGGFVRIADGDFDHAVAARLVRSAARTDSADVEEFDRATLA